jgi:hypothetical protein
MPEWLEDRLEREEVLLMVVDQQNVRAAYAHGATSTQSP